MEKQRTIKEKVAFEGRGLHTGKNCKIELLPAPPNTGIVFLRKDIPSSSLIKADLYSVLDPDKFPRRTSVGVDGVYVHTIEHLMAALHLLKIDNLQINIWEEEIPGLDGSAKDFVEDIKKVGWVEQTANREYLLIREPVWVEEGTSCIVILPSPNLRISYTLKYDNPLIGLEYINLVLDREIEDALYQARTFCLEEEVKPLLEMGLGKGANYQNTLVVAKDGIKENELRFEDEFVKHKILDLIGDLYLAGSIKGYVIAIRSGHSLNIKLLHKLRKYREKIRRGGVASHQAYVPQGGELNTEEIMKILPHRYPFLLVDRILYVEKGKKAIGVKNVTINEFFFQGHFPQRPVMPGVLIIEAMAQVGGVLMLACEENKGKLAYFLAANNVKFRKTVEPGDQLVIEVMAGKIKSKTGTIYAKAFVDDKIVAEAELMFALVDS
ncbi:MAG TPA: UDP-3-O-[3-hydroxymyristoyl] N-acetylglucosamine deacetylase [Candidatus Omnitrophica bacterium]|nr:UDP-3-O-[3-hydroxymyristoyl] N-acetylglucosamine deacetylase [Candidatus Omnitrophota bacterium]